MDAKLDQFLHQLLLLAKDEQDRKTIANLVESLDTQYALGRKIAHEPETKDILIQLLGRIVAAFGTLSNVKGLSILDIACGSNSSRLPASMYLRTLLKQITSRPTQDGYTALFEPWFCRMLLELGAQPVGIDFGDLEGELFIHHKVDLGKKGALDFLPTHSFDGVQDSRLFGSPEFTAMFPDPNDRIQVAREIVMQEHRLLKPGGVVIHSDAVGLI